MFGNICCYVVGSLFMLLVVGLFSVTLISLRWLLTWVVVFMVASAWWFWYCL